LDLPLSGGEAKELAVEPRLVGAEFGRLPGHNVERAILDWSTPAMTLDACSVETLIERASRSCAEFIASEKRNLAAIAFGRDARLVATTVAFPAPTTEVLKLI
jgi:hypothetical protein